MKEKTKFNFMDPANIMSVVVALVILAVGVFAFFTILSSIDNFTSNKSQEAISNISDNYNDWFNVIGVVLIIGAIMIVAGMVHNFIRPDYDYSSHDDEEEEDDFEEEKIEKPIEKIEKKNIIIQKEDHTKVKKEPRKKKEGWQI